MDRRSPHGKGLFDSSPSTPEPVRRRRFGEPLKFLPILFVVCTILTLYTVYVFCHCLPMLQMNVAPLDVDHNEHRRGVTQLVFFHAVTVMLMICYVRSVLTHPGQIPDHDSQWEYLPQDGRGAGEVAPMNLQESKRSGDRRHCKWCGKYKPDRCHHCRVCKTCILKMDHHCPWIYNCVGFGNYKYFFLLLLYCVIDLHFIFWTMAESVQAVIYDPTTPFGHMFCILFGEVLAAFLGVLTTMFFGFHLWLMVKAMTTIEFCEKSLPKKDKIPPTQEELDKQSYEISVYDLGFVGNFRTVMGDDPFFWLLPVGNPIGDGLNFMSDETRLTTDMEAGRGTRRKTHQKTQRTPRRVHGVHGRGVAYGDDQSGLLGTGGRTPPLGSSGSGGRYTTDLQRSAQYGYGYGTSPYESTYEAAY